MTRICSCGTSHPARPPGISKPGSTSKSGKAVTRDITVYIDGWDTVFSTFVFDVLVIVPSMNSFWRFSQQSPRALRLSDTVGAIQCHEVPLLTGGVILVECTDNRNGRMFKPSSSTDPFKLSHLEWKLTAKTAMGSVADANTSTKAVTDPQWNGSGSVSMKEQGKILGFGVESTQTGQITRNGQLNVNTNQNQRTVTTPTELVLSADLHRTMGRPDLALNITPGQATSRQVANG